MPICGSPWLIAACRVLRRLPVPRHSPCALFRLTSVQLPVPRCRNPDRSAFASPSVLRSPFSGLCVVSFILVLSFGKYCSKLPQPKHASLRPCPPLSPESAKRFLPPAQTAFLYFLPHSQFLCSIFKVPVETETIRVPVLPFPEFPPRRLIPISFFSPSPHIPPRLSHCRYRQSFAANYVQL